MQYFKEPKTRTDGASGGGGVCGACAEGTRARAGAGTLTRNCSLGN